jgi:hypothetical protein
LQEALEYVYCWRDEGSTGIGEHPSFYSNEMRFYHQ